MRLLKKNCQPLALAIPFLFSAPSHAQTPWVQGEETVVVGQLLQVPLADVLPSVTVISKQDIQNAPARDLFELINGLPGVEATRTGPMGSPISVSMRGASSAQTLVLIDGMPTSSQSSIGAISSVEAVPLAMIQRIEILRGNATAQYGQGAVGGVINIMTTGAANDLMDGASRTQASVTLGRFAEHQVAASVATKFDGNALSLSLGKNESRGYSALNPTSYSNGFGGFYAANPGPTGYASEFYNMSWSRQVSKETELGFKASHSKLNSQFDNIYADSPTDVWENKTTISLYSLYVKQSITRDWLTRVQYSDSQNDQATYTNGAFNQSYGSFLTRYKNWNWENTYALTDHQLVSFGLTTSHIQLNANHLGYLSDYSTVPISITPGLNTSRFYAGLASQWDRWNTQLTLSQDQLGQGISTGNFLAGVGYGLGGGYKATATRSSAMLAPTVGQKYDPSYGGNPSLFPERSFSDEAGIQFSSQNLNWRLVAFKVQYQNMISSGTQLVSDPFWAAQHVYQLENLNHSRNKGYEWSSTWRNGPLSLGLNLTVQSPENLNTNVKPINKAGRFGSLRAGYDFSGRTKLNWMTYMTSDRYTISPSPNDTAASPSRASGYAVHSLALNHQWDANWSGKFSLMNVFDKHYSPIVGYAPQPRTWMFTLSHQSF
jgi:vitamin B12 transporter